MYWIQMDPAAAYADLTWLFFDNFADHHWLESGAITYRKRHVDLPVDRLTVR